MALLTLEGVYEDGIIELSEKPAGVKKARVVVTFLSTDALTDAGQHEALRGRVLTRLQRGVDFGTESLPTREELYADRFKRV